MFQPPWSISCPLLETPGIWGAEQPEATPSLVTGHQEPRVLLLMDPHCDFEKMTLSLNQGMRLRPSQKVTGYYDNYKDKIRGGS